MKENKKGISLIVLVITIIVMIILASAVIISLTGNSVIDRANEAVDKTNEANVQQLASTLWAEAYLDGTKTKEGFTTKIKDGLREAGINPEEYGIIATTSGVTVKKGWAKDGFTVVKGEQILEIGDIVHYDETAGGTIEFGEENPEDVTWKVLGADKDGNLLLMSTTDIVSSYRLGYEDSMTGSAVKLAESQKDWLNGAAELNGLCEPYGYGKGVVGKARSIRVEDVDSVTGYDKTTYGYGKGVASQYGNEVTYSYNGTTNPAYTSKVASGTLTATHSNGFYYYDGKEFKVANDLTSKDTGTITTLKSDYYHYATSKLTTISKTENTKAYEMMFGKDDIIYWLACRYISTRSDHVTFGMCAVNEGQVGGYILWYSYGGSTFNGKGVRAVVTLSSDITFTGNSTDGWSY